MNQDVMKSGLDIDKQIDFKGDWNLIQFIKFVKILI